MNQPLTPTLSLKGEGASAEQQSGTEATSKAGSKRNGGQVQAY